jgi:hypothetical protein
MSLPKILSYEIKIARTEQPVPVINGVHLHSIYNPDKEADGLVAAQVENLQNKNEVLVLGLGFGYHVNAIIEKLTEFHGENFKVIVIEPNSKVYDDCIEKNLLNKKNLQIYAGFNANELYSDLDLVHLLLRKPAIIAHPASFNLYQLYFKQFLSFEAPKDIASIIGFVNSPVIKNYLSQFDGNVALENALFNELPQKKEFSETDFLAMALVEMTRKSIELNQQAGE